MTTSGTICLRCTLASYERLRALSETQEERWAPALRIDTTLGRLRFAYPALRAVEMRFAGVVFVPRGGPLVGLYPHETLRDGKVHL